MKLLFPWLLVVGSATCGIVKVHKASELIDLSKEVNSGTGHSGDTVLLESDIDFNGVSGQFEPIGVNFSVPFLGTFDGQGHTINNLVVNTSSFYSVGLIGHSLGGTVRNVVMDSSCSMESHLTDEDIVVMGPVMGICTTVTSNCVAENNVNMASLTMSGSGRISNHIIGGVLGWFFIHSSHDHTSFVENCANYGKIEVYGNFQILNIGGVIGGITGELKISAFVRNVLSAGHIYYRLAYGKKISAGGITGLGYNVNFENCVFSSEFNVTKQDVMPSYIVSDYKFIDIKNCFWLGINLFYPTGTSSSRVGCFSFDETFELSVPISVGSRTERSLVRVLNAFVDRYYMNGNYSHWILSEEEISISSTVNGVGLKPFRVTSRLAMLQNIATESGGKTHFYGWYTDEACTEELSDFELANDTTLYGRVTDSVPAVAITFDTRSSIRPPSQIRSPPGLTLVLPSITDTRKDCTFMGWVDDFEEFVPWNFTVPFRDVTLYASWLCTRITSVNELFEFSRSVNVEALKTDEVVTIDADLDFSGFKATFEPIGINNDDDDDFFFKGTFDGQGHTIRNLKISSSKEYIGLFGFSSHGLTIQNVVIDSSCSFDVKTADVKSASGSMIGFCSSGSTPCVVRNSINNANMTLYDSINKDLYCGGIIGYCSYNCLIYNCVNYGNIVHNEGVYDNLYLGGIIGKFHGTKKTTVSVISNNINYGKIDQLDGIGEYEYSGGIAGYARACKHLENCVNFGVLNSATTFRITGSIVGGVQDSDVTWCYWKNKYGIAVGDVDEGSHITNTSVITDDFQLEESVSVGSYKGSSLIDALNAYVKLDTNISYSEWVMNKGKNRISFRVKGLTLSGFSLSSQVALLPSLAEREETLFDGWFKNHECTERLNTSVLTENIHLYGILSLRPEDSHAKSAAFITVVTCVSMAVFFVLVIVAYFVCKKIRKRALKNRELRELIEPLLFDGPSGALANIEDLYPEDYEEVSIKKALMRAGVGHEEAGEAAFQCYERAGKIHELGMLQDDMTVEDAGAIVLYTMEFENSSLNPYRMINNALMDGSLKALHPVKDILYIVMKALRKLPIVYGKPLYRSIRTHIGTKTATITTAPAAPKIYSRYSNDMVEGKSSGASCCVYNEGDEITWHGISSTSPDVSVTKAFLARCSASGKAEGTLFIIEDGWGYNVQLYSMFPEEEEIVIEPGRRFKVLSVIPGEGLYIVKLKMMKTPLLLPEVFGTKRFGLF